MPGPAPVELLADCEACGLEGGVVEVYDPLVAACRFGLPASTRCKLCAAATEGVFERRPAKPLGEIPANRCPACLNELPPSAIDDRRCGSCGASAAVAERAAPIRFTTLADLERALDAWAEREQFASRQALVDATLAERDITILFTMLARQERLEALADPFANMGTRTTGGGRERGGDRRPKAKGALFSGVASDSTSPSPRTSSPARSIAQAPSIDATPLVALPRADNHPLREPAPTRTVPLAAPLPSSTTSPPPPSAPPRAIVYPLVSVIAADGEIHPEERALIDRFLASEGLHPLADHEFVVHHPSAVAHLVPQGRREEVVKLMCETAAIDGMPDESERRVIRAYATAWNVDDEKIDFWMWGYETMNTPLARQLWLRLRRFVLAARWGEAPTHE